MDNNDVQSSLELRVLTEADVEIYRAVRLRALQDHPEAFGSSFEEEQSMTVEQYAERLQHGLPDSFTLAVTAGNETARRLYLDAGFMPWGVEPRYIKVGEQRHDIEWMILGLRSP